MNGLLSVALKRSAAVTFMLAGLAACAFAADAKETDAEGTTTEWPNWRGPTHDGISMEKGWLTVWPEEGPERLWKVELGRGHSSVAVKDGKVYTMGRADKQDIVFCLSADTGETLWKYSYAAKESSYGGGPRATPAVDGGTVYTMSADGQVFCIDAASGEMIWKKDLVSELNFPMPMQFFGGSPVIEGDLLLLNVGTSGAALDKKTGDVVWKSEGDSSYSSPVPFTLGARRCVALFAATQLVVVDFANGEKIASYEWKTQNNTNCADPVIAGDRIFITSDYGSGCALVSVGGGDAVLVWKKGFECHYANPVLVGDYLYALIVSGWIKADLVCLDLADGSLKWTQKDVGSGGLMAADGKLIILSRDGDLILAEASPAAYMELARTRLLPPETATTKSGPVAWWNSPVLSGGRIYARNDKGTLVCIDVRRKQSQGSE